MGHLIERDPRCVDPTDERAHTGAGNAGDRNPHLLEHLEHPDVGDAPRTPSTQDEAHARRLCIRMRVAGDNQYEEEEQRDERA
ncbi:hypothetical protein YTPLAS18_29110 [Nitrospira sp.]|nr:hypothetical protein YTPLAS18_29110 [Nitrospira sp.]